MIRLYLLLSVVLFVVSVPVGLRAQDGGLQGINDVRIDVESMSESCKKIGLKKQDILDQLYVFVKAKLPRLAVKQRSRFLLSVANTCVESREVYSFFILFEISRPLSIKESGNIVSGVVFTDGGLRVGSSDSAAVAVHGMLEKYLTKFAADWYRDNPSK